jgi:eukaryotic-like serine/threonine-protein kinase
MIPAAPDDLPKTIGRYKIQARLAGTSSNDVYRGFDPMIERPVVVKVFRLDSIDPAAGAALKQAFYQEMQRTGLLMHHGIAALFDAGEQPGMLFMATEYVDGDSLAARLAAGITWDVTGRASVISQMLDALDFACQLGVPHLNLKPTNVVIGQGHAVKVGGFGVGSFGNRLAAASNMPVTAASRYTAPERANGQPGDQRSDVYSSAVIAHEVFLGLEPGPDWPAYLASQGVKKDQLDQVFARALSADPELRFPTPETLKIELLLALGVGDAQVWYEPQPAGGYEGTETPPDAVTMLTPSGVYVFPDSAGDAVTVAAEPDFPTDVGDLPTMMDAPRKKKE